MEVINTDIEGVVIIKPKLFRDGRGYFFESFSQKDFNLKVSNTVFVQDNQSMSSYGTLRGLHFQKPPYSQSKLIRVIKGRILDIAVDIRKDSSTYGQYVSVELSEDNNYQLYIPHGFAHGFVSLEEGTIIQYKCDNFYNKESEGGLMWNDIDLAIDWMIPNEEIILSDRDKINSTFKDFISPF